MDFNLIIYSKLLETLLRQGFSFCTFLDYFERNIPNRIILRHDVDALPMNSLRFAQIQAEMGIRGSYYFRVVPGSWDEAVIKEIAELGHEVGYHYEDLSFAWAKLKAEGWRQKAEGLRDEETKGLRDIGNKRRRDLGLKREELDKEFADIAIESFAENLEKLRKIAPVKTICMHGSPMSRWDSRLLWKYYDYKDFGIVGEPYFDVDFDEVMYLTDTGRRWDGEAVSVRDKAIGEKEWEKGRRGEGEKSNPFESWKVKPFKYREESGGEKDLETKRLGDEETKRRKDEKESLSPSVPQSLSPSVSQSLSPSVPQSPSPSVPQSLSPSVSCREPHAANRMPFPKFHSTSDIIRTVENGQLPDKMMMTFHPQRWTDKPVPWAKELVWQNVKNVVKYFLVKSR